MFSRLKSSFGSCKNEKPIYTKYTHSSSNAVKESTSSPQFISSQVKDNEEHNLSQNLSQINNETDQSKSQIGQLIKQFTNLGQKFNEINEQLNQRLSEQYFIDKHEIYKFGRRQDKFASEQQANSQSYIDKLQIQVNQNDILQNPISRKLQKQRSKSKSQLNTTNKGKESKLQRTKQKLQNNQEEISNNLQIVKKLTQENKQLKEQNTFLKEKLSKIKEQYQKENAKIIKQQLNTKLIQQQIQFKNYINSLNQKINELIAQNVKYEMKNQQKSQCIVGMLLELKKMQMKNIEYIQIKDQCYELKNINNSLTVKNQQLSKKVYNFSGPVQHLWSIKQIQYQNIKTILRQMDR